MKHIGQKMNEIKHAVCLLQPVGDNHYLSISRRNKPKELGIPGGKVDEGETLEHAIVRETFEETRLNLDPTKLIRLFTGICEGEQTFLVTTFLAPKISMHEVHSLVPEEGMVFAVLREEELGDDLISPFADYNRRVFKELKNYVKYL